MSRQTHDAAPVKNTTEARQGEATGRIGLVLVISLVLVIFLFALVAVVISKF